jgi:uncharacterized protein YbgA (DUF1722 family)/uncharacterized protein YbbK (DUF523 family)
VNRSILVSRLVPLRIGISRCLLGDTVRYDGGHKKDEFLTEVFGQFVEWVPVCPEVEAGFGTPREAMRLVGEAGASRLITIKTGRDHTQAMERFSHRRVRELKGLDLSGYVFKKDSPSCGLERVRLYSPHGMPSRTGVGIFARAFQNQFPLIPVEEEGRLNDPVIRENFIERVFCYHRWRSLTRGRLTRQALVAFHSTHKYLLLAHSREHYQTLGRLAGNAHLYRPSELAQRYGVLLMKTLKVKATVRKHVNVLNHIVGYFTNRLGKAEKEELHDAISDYHRGLTPLIVPLTLVKHYVRLFDITYMQGQVYLNPHPKELMLRNRV